MDVVESTKSVDLGVDWERQLRECKKKCAGLELVIERKNSEFKCLEDKFRVVVAENLEIKEEFGVLNKKYDDLEKRVLENGNEDRGKEELEEKVLKLMAEKKVFEAEKGKAESEVKVWKAKFEVLELQVMKLEGRNKDCNMAGKVKSETGIRETGSKEVGLVDRLRDGSSHLKCSTHLQAESTVKNSRGEMHNVAGVITSAQPSIEVTNNLKVSEETLATDAPSLAGTGTRTVRGSQVRKQLAYGEGSPRRTRASSIPGGSRRASTGVIDIGDTDGEHEMIIPNASTRENEDNKTVSTDHLGINLNVKECASDNKIEETFLHQSCEDMIGGKENSPLNATRKRRRAANIVNSDSEDEDIQLPNLNVDTQPESVMDFRSNSSPVHGTELGNGVHKIASKRRLVTLGNAASTPKRKGEPEVVTVGEGGGGDDDDDDVPISQLVTNVSSVRAAVLRNRVPYSISKRRLASLRKFSDNWLQKSPNTESNLNALETNYEPRNFKEDDSDDASTDENATESSDESMEGFIDDRSDISVKSDGEDSLLIESDSGNSISKNSDHGEASGDSENISCDDMNYPEIMSQLRRKRDSHTSKWEFEAEMLADFGKDPKMCMKAVCALYRQQTIDEQSIKGAIHRNNRGFSLRDAYRGTSMAEFLTGGSGLELRKSVEELKQHSSKGIELCRELAKHYSKQLFTIYTNKEDPFFHPDKIHD
ncbi:hypothetical protein DCAR_0626121 [Daucus carota subsp. sativus]|uniref:Uncharacterized protein n=1 Tax=Daucus carota subsp. sativus TaxID=79200 RepID=A0AAF0XEM8_DAUCS|nr:PREDICTED: uncharacterized protein LOC108227905 [Daucus carota subsp. sativus]XP_017258786.1 PREDICTED: uncharacterized protein LOC108227905 [Daucus carota subsp. sativus]WOH06693.1 hypothetical protein DCAR_0626121 [Daucus carota subsp. sativus]